MVGLDRGGVPADPPNCFCPWDVPPICAAIGEAMGAAPRADFIVTSDHGFSSFDRGFQLNAWLAENSFLALRGRARGEGFVGVDWSRTQAYGLGLNGLYVNLRGRETKGT